MENFLNLDAVLLARLQFAFLISFHIIFPAASIGLAGFLAVIEWQWLRTGNVIYAEIYKLWIKIFAIFFGVGVVTGVVMSYQFGTNWSLFSDKIGNVLGPLLGYEVLTAFFLEASFLGIMLFGWGKVSKKMHFAATCIVAIGTTISAFWILSANSWMQTPQGFSVVGNGILHPTNWLEIIFNPSFPYRFTHMMLGAYLTTTFIVGGIAAHYLLKKTHIVHAKIMLKMAVFMALIVAPLQAVVGDMHGINTLEYQPAKVAAMEGIWETEKGAGMRLFAIPNQKEQKNDFEIVIPKLASFILTHDWDGEIKGLKEWNPQDIPPVAPVFYAFRVMVSIGLSMIFMGVLGAYLYKKGTLFDNRFYLHLFRIMTPVGWVAVLAGWFVTEIGRQPYTVYGVLRTTQSISPVAAESILASLIAFIILYIVMTSSAFYYIFKLVKKGPHSFESNDSDGYYTQGRIHSIAAHMTSGEKNV